MKKLAFAFSVASLLGIGAVANAETKIVGGQAISIASMPYQVSLQGSINNPGHYCGGALIKQDWVLTAAHCVPYSTMPKSIVVGTDRLSSGGVRLYPDSVFIHPNYDPSNQENDIALIYLKQSAPGHLAPLELISGGNVGDLVTISGFGALGEGGAVSDTLQAVNLPVVNNQICQDANNRYWATIAKPWLRIVDSMFCAGFAQGGQDSCQGDSGGPVITTEPSGTHYSKGIVSYGPGCARPNVYGVYTRTDSYVSWINNTIRQKSAATSLVKSINDSSGKVTVSVFRTSSIRSQSNFRDFNVNVPDDYVVIGGGVLGTNMGNGHLITASYPNRQLTAWKVSTKDHQQPQPINIEAYAIGLKIAGLTRAQLMNYLSVSSTTSASLAHSEARASVKSTQVLIGGGMNVRWWDQGNLATASYPLDATTWVGESKDHIKPSPASITTYAIGIDKIIPGVGTVQVNFSQRSSLTASHPTVSSPLEPGFALTSCGAKVQWAGAGNLLWKISPLLGSSNGCDVASKDHLIYSPASIIAYTIGIKILP